MFKKMSSFTATTKRLYKYIAFRCIFVYITQTILFFHHNIIYSKSAVYNNLDDTGARPCFTSISLVQGQQVKKKRKKSSLKHISYSFVFTFHHNIHNQTIQRPFLLVTSITYQRWVRIMVFNATFNNISVISWRTVLIGGGIRINRRKPPTCRKSLTNFIT